jgi:hypothetical protein
MLFPAFLLIALVAVNQMDASRILLPSSNSSCTTKHGEWLLSEGEKVTIQGKFYKVEDCQLQRTYQTCGTHLWFMINIVCQAIELQKQKTGWQGRARRFVEQKLLTEACCENSCTVSEMTRYCPEEIIE